MSQMDLSRLCSPTLRRTVTAIRGSDLGEPQEVAFETSDGVLITGMLTPTGEEGCPAVILVHQFSSNRCDWDGLDPISNQRGYSALSYDIRGIGEST